SSHSSDSPSRTSSPSSAPQSPPPESQTTPGTASRIPPQNQSPSHRKAPQPPPHIQNKVVSPAVSIRLRRRKSLLRRLHHKHHLRQLSPLLARQLGENQIFGPLRR